MSTRAPTASTMRGEPQRTPRTEPKAKRGNDLRRLSAAAGRALLGVLALNSRAAGEGLFGSLQMQTQHIDEVTFVQAPGGGFVAKRTARDLFLQTYDVNHRDTPRENILLHTALHFTGVSSPNSPNTIRTPEGTIRLLHPWVSLLASRRQSVTKLSLAATGSPATDTIGVLSTTTRLLEDQFVARVALPRWPELTGSWRSRR